jgi:hypothetical protein
MGPYRIRSVIVFHIDVENFDEMGIPVRMSAGVDGVLLTSKIICSIVDLKDTVFK